MYGSSPCGNGSRPCLSRRRRIRYADRRRLWKAAIKWPMYSVAVMPVLLAAGWQFGVEGSLRCLQLVGFVLAAIPLLLWRTSATMSLMRPRVWMPPASPIPW